MSPKQRISDSRKMVARLATARATAAEEAGERAAAFSRDTLPAVPRARPRAVSEASESLRPMNLSVAPPPAAPSPRPRSRMSVAFACGVGALIGGLGAVALVPHLETLQARFGVSSAAAARIEIPVMAAPAAAPAPAPQPVAAPPQASPASPASPVAPAPVAHEPERPAIAASAVLVHATHAPRRAPARPSVTPRPRKRVSESTVAASAPAAASPPLSETEIKDAADAEALARAQLESALH